MIKRFSMKQGFALAVIGLMILSACMPSGKKGDPQELEAVLTGYFDGIRTRDFAKMKRAITDDFRLYEEGKVWNNDSVIKEINRRPFTVEFRFTDFRTFVDTESGDLSCFENAAFVFYDTAKYDLHFLTSAAFRKTQDGWKMSFLHATPRKKKK